MMRTTRRKLLQWGGTALAMAGLTLGLTATTASANGTNGTYKFCSYGTYKSFAQYVPTAAEAASGLSGLSTVIVLPGQCIPIKMDGQHAVDIYLEYDDGGQVLLGRAWYQANIATAGYKSTAYWYFF
ncbi:hypothetical protein [Streptomyces sp. NBC_00102]|uniref:hypothetical protein n=1 Tax=Streptomyces sp. NBC_00102 TaxID=2975652 RepID=UPI00224E2D23|nr:hypothetical protein [Streptomyces sp. NBC_00102]MCX5400482.1 hypothetical protein [Streptomyces sp. NBC_00102]